MKKIIIITTLLLMSFAGTSFAKDLDGLEGIVSLSNAVSGTYFSSSSSNDATDFVISTGHAQGGYVYGTGNFTTAIYRNVLASDAFASSDLITSAPGSWDATTAFPSTWGPI